MLRKDIREFLNTIPKGITLVAATKYMDVFIMKDMLKAGINNFGENRVDSFLNKYELLKNEKDVVWHFIGHLQRNKAKDVINKIDYLHSLDSLELAKMIENYRISKLKVFVEISINLEKNKNGVPYFEAEEFINNLKQFQKIEVVGLMMMADLNHEDAKNQFHKLKELRENLEKKCQIKLPYLSMGMSEDYLQAIEEGATHIRLGRILYSDN